MPEKYTLLDEVPDEHEELPVLLKLQIRNDVPPCPYHTLSWRTNNVSGEKNRFSYFDRKHGTGFWKIPVEVALRMLEAAEEKGFLDERYNDPQTRHEGTNNRTIDSRCLNTRELSSYFDSIGDDETENWGQAPTFIIIEVPDKTWRKIMIVDSDREFCTFRSTTTETSYGRKSFRAKLTCGWILDNAMQDASVTMMRQFLQVLREL